MRTRRATGQTGQVAAFALFSDLRRVTITPSEVASPSLAAPKLLPKSDSCLQAKSSRRGPCRAWAEAVGHCPAVLGFAAGPTGSVLQVLLGKAQVRIGRRSADPRRGRHDRRRDHLFRLRL